MRPQVTVLRRTWTAFRACGYAGLGLAILFALIMAFPAGLSLAVMSGVVIAAVGTFFVQVMVIKMITGKEKLTFYRNMVAVLAAISLLLWLIGQPALAYLDLVVLGLGLCLSCARMGCLMVGCCHGRPCSWGVTYRREHAEAGFTSYYVGVRLFPVQAIESILVLGIVAAGSVASLRGGRPGAALAWFVAAYGIVRFCLEFARGNPERVYVWGFSEAQWTSLLLLGAVCWLERAGAIPPVPWHLAAMVAMAAAMTAVRMHRLLRRSADHLILHPHHVREVAEAIERSLAPAGSVGADPLKIRVGMTSLGICISAATIGSGADCAHHYALSGKSKSIDEEEAGAMARLIRLLRHPGRPYELLAPRQGVFHLIVRSAQRSGQAVQ